MPGLVGDVIGAGALGYLTKRSEKEAFHRAATAVVVSSAVRSALIAAAAVTPEAAAWGTWTVTGGPDFTAVQEADTTFTFTDTTASPTITCTVATARGTVTDQRNSTNTAIASITGSTFGSSTVKCKGPFGSTIAITQKPGTTMTVNVGSYDSVTGVATGTITGGDWILSVTGLSCSAEVKGTAGFTYANSSSFFAFTITGDSLKIASSSCPFFSVNDTITLSGRGLKVTGSPVNPILASQP